jgi:hypothetical protein
MVSLFFDPHLTMHKIKYRCMITKSDQITLAYIIWQLHRILNVALTFWSAHSHDICFFSESIHLSGNISKNNILSPVEK